MVGGGQGRGVGVINNPKLPALGSLGLNSLFLTITTYLNWYIYIHKHVYIYAFMFFGSPENLDFSYFKSMEDNNQ